MGDNESAFASNLPELPELNSSDIDSNRESERKTFALRRYMRNLFSRYVDRQSLPPAESKAASRDLEPLKEILAKRHPDIIQKTVEAAAEKNLPLEAEFEHRHEIKGDASVSTAPDPDKPVAKTKSKAKSKAKPDSRARARAKTKAEQKAKARRVAQKFVEPVAGRPMVRVNPVAKVEPVTQQQPATPQMSAGASATRRAVRQAMAAAILVGLAIIAYLAAG